VLARLTRDLGLRPDRRQRVEAILTGIAGEFAHLREEVGPPKFDALVRRWGERQAERWRGGAQGAKEKEPEGP